MPGRRTLHAGDASYEVVALDASVARLPYSLRVLLENVTRTGSEAEVEAVAGWDPAAEPSHEVSFSPARVLLHDTTGVPAVVDLAAMRDAVYELGGDPRSVNPRLPSVLVIDHSLQVDAFATPGAMERNVAREYERNGERYRFLRWGQVALDGFQVGGRAQAR